MGNNNSEILKKILSLYMKELTLYVKYSSKFSFIAYVYRKDMVVAFISKGSDEPYSITLNPSFIDEIEDLFSIEYDTPTSKKVISSLMFSIIKQNLMDKINNYLIEPSSLNKMSNSNTKIFSYFSTLAGVKYEYKINLY